MVAEKKLTLDDPLSRFSLGVTIPNADDITVRELCNMRSGLFEAYDTPQFAQLNWKVPKDFNPRTLVGWAMQQKSYFPPGKGYRYSNTNYLLIGMIIEEVTKDSRWKPGPQTALGAFRIEANLLSGNRSHAEPVGARIPSRQAR